MRKVSSTPTSGVNPRRLHPTDYIKVTILGLGLSTVWSSLHSVILPIRLLDFVAESQKNTYLGLITFAGLFLAMLLQPLVGAISDRSTFRWGRRRPYILFGTILALLLLPGIGLAGSYGIIFVTYCLLQLSGNIAQAPYQALIPDLIPQEKRGLAAGVKSLLEMMGGLGMVRLVAYLMDRHLTEPESLWLWYALAILSALLLGTMLATVLLIKERPGSGGSKPPLLPSLYRSFQINIRGNRDFIFFLVSRLLIIMALTTLQTFAFYFIRDVVSATSPAAVTADLLIAVGAGMLVAVYPAGRLSDWVGRRPVVASSGLLGALGIILLLYSHQYGYLMLAGGLLGIATGAFMSSNWALATDLVVEGEEARYLGLTNLATAGGAALARLIGPIIDPLNQYRPGLGYQVMLLACLAYFLLGSAVVLGIKRPDN